VTNAKEAADRGLMSLKIYLDGCSKEEIRLLVVKCGGTLSGTNEVAKRERITMFYFEDWNTPSPRRRLSTEDVNTYAEQSLQLSGEYNAMRVTNPTMAEEIYMERLMVLTRLLNSNQAVRARYLELRAAREASFWSEVEVKKVRSIVLSQEECSRVEAKVVQCCNICYDDVKKSNMVGLNCAHEFCTTCIDSTLKNVPNRQSPSCALCRAEMSNFKVHSNKAFKHMQKALKH
jgi:hypothetical protein